MWKAIWGQISQRFFLREVVENGSSNVHYLLRKRPSTRDPEAEYMPANPETSHLTAVPAEILKSILQYAVADSVIEVRQVQRYESESAIRIIDFPTGEVVNAGGSMPCTASSLLRVNRMLNQGVLDLLALPDTLFCRNPAVMVRLMKEMDKVQSRQMRRSRRRTRIHIHKIICSGGKYEDYDPWIFLPETDEEAVKSLGVFVMGSKHDIST